MKNKIVLFFMLFCCLFSISVFGFSETVIVKKGGIREFSLYENNYKYIIWNLTSYKGEGYYKTQNLSNDRIRWRYATFQSMKVLITEVGKDDIPMMFEFIDDNSSIPYELHNEFIYTNDISEFFVREDTCNGWSIAGYGGNQSLDSNGNGNGGSTPEAQDKIEHKFDKDNSELEINFGDDRYIKWESSKFEGKGHIDVVDQNGKEVIYHEKYRNDGSKYIIFDKNEIDGDLIKFIFNDKGSGGSNTSKFSKSGSDNGSDSGSGSGSDGDFNNGSNDGEINNKLDDIINKFRQLDSDDDNPLLQKILNVLNSIDTKIDSILEYIINLLEELIGFRADFNKFANELLRHIREIITYLKKLFNELVNFHNDFNSFVEGWNKKIDEIIDLLKKIWGTEEELKKSMDRLVKSFDKFMEYEPFKVPENVGLALKNVGDFEKKNLPTIKATIVPGYEPITIFDLKPWLNEIKMIRKLMVAILYISLFFYFVRALVPKLKL